MLSLSAGQKKWLATFSSNCVVTWRSSSVLFWKQDYQAHQEATKRQHRMSVWRVLILADAFGQQKTTVIIQASIMAKATLQMSLASMPWNFFTSKKVLPVLFLLCLQVLFQPPPPKNKKPNKNPSWLQIHALKNQVPFKKAYSLSLKCLEMSQQQ